MQEKQQMNGVNSICKKVVFAFAIVIFITTCNKLTWYNNRERFEPIGGHISYSPDKNWVVYMISGKSEGVLLCKIYVLSTITYPILLLGELPDDYQLNNPTALYSLPIQFHARQTQFEWSLNSGSILLKNGSLEYEIDLTNFSLCKTN